MRSWLNGRHGVVFWWGRPARPTWGSRPRTLLFSGLTHMRMKQHGRPPDKNTPCERQEVGGQRLESEQEKQVRISSLQSCLCSDLFWTCSSSSHEQDECVYLHVGGLLKYFFVPLCCFVRPSWDEKPKASSQSSVAGPATRCWIQRKWRALWMCWRSQRAGVWTVMRVWNQRKRTFKDVP